MERNFGDRRWQGVQKYFVIIFGLVIIGGGGALSFLPQFERGDPKIDLKQNEYWNLKSPLEITLSDNSNIVSYKVTFSDGDGEQILEEKVVAQKTPKLKLAINPPKFDTLYKGKEVSVTIEAHDDSSIWMSGNSAKETYNLKVDTKAPEAIVLDNSRYIARGGSAVVVVKVEDDNLLDAVINFSDTTEFKLLPYYQPHYYAAIIAWDIALPFENFSGANVIARDKAGNKTVAKIPLYIQDSVVKVDTITIPQTYIETVSKSVLENMGQDVPVDLVERFVKQNRTLREQNIAKIKEVSQKNLGQNEGDFLITPFERLAGSRTAAGFGERRHYLFNGEKIDEAWHLGQDWASVKQDSILTSNSGKVIFDEYLGIYGNTIIIDHGLGLGSLYAHTTDQFVQVGDSVQKGQKIATTGVSGAVLGDHLHFGMLVQGIEVNPLEWMDKNWIQTRILDILANSKAKMASGQK